VIPEYIGTIKRAYYESEFLNKGVTKGASEQVNNSSFAPQSGHTAKNSLL
jgi:hypothetical protein